jgi:7-carboxy-7-deazaguanine synthase (Cx14CxxC type)
VSYLIKELFYTLQGEGRHAGRPAVFCRFSGCNLWSGREEDRAQAICSFCDTDFRGTDGENGGKYTAQSLAQAAMALWPGGGKPYIVCTGGEPLLQLDTPLIDAFHHVGFEIAVETNGTIAAPPCIDWICVSPKAGAACIQTHGHELKLVFPQPAAWPDTMTGWDFKYFYLQPMDGPYLEANTNAVIAYCKAHPQWHLSIQTHKILQIP